MAMVLMNHGVFTFGDTTEVAYAKMIEVITEAEEYLKSVAEVDIAASAALANSVGTKGATIDQAILRNELSAAAGSPMLLARTANVRSASFAARTDVIDVACRGHATPDHIIRT